MGLAIASKNNNRVYLAIDSMYNGVIDTDSFKNINNYQLVNVKPDRNVFIAYQGAEKKLIDLLKKEKELFPNTCFENEKIKLDYLVNNFVPKLYELLETNKIIDSSDQSKYITGELIIATKHQLFMVYMDGAIVEEYDFVAIGNSDTFAYGAYKAIDDCNNEKNRLIKMFDTVTKSSYKVKFPILIIDVTYNEFEVIFQDFTESMVKIEL